MRKITLILMSLCLAVGVMAQTMPTISQVPTNGQWASGTKFYTIKNAKNNYLTSDVLKSGTYLKLGESSTFPDNSGYWCVVGNDENGYSFYNCETGKILAMSHRDTDESVSFARVLGTDELEGKETKFDFVPSKKSNYWCLKVHGTENTYWTQHGNNGYASFDCLSYWKDGRAVTGWNSWDNGDDGSAFIFEEVDVLFDGMLYRIKNRYRDLSYLYTTYNDQSNRGDGKGAYLSSTKRVIGGCQFLKSEDEGDYKACEIRCDNATLADAGSVWKFEEATNGWKIKNMNNGSYIGAERNGSYVKFVKESNLAAIFTINQNSDGYVTLYDESYGNGTNNYLHASGAGLQIWNASSTASHWTIEPATELEVTVSSADYASIYLPFDVTIPEGENLKAYAVTSTKGGYAKLEEMTTGLPANNGAILEGAGTHTLNIEEATSDWDENLLRGSNVNTYVEGDAFVLANGENGVGLYKAALNKGENGADGDTHFLNNANKAYLSVSSTQGANMLRFDFGGETTGVDAVEVENNVKTIYDLSGRKVSNMSAPGLYIVNGKKVLVK